MFLDAKLFQRPRLNQRWEEEAILDSPWNRSAEQEYRWASLKLLPVDCLAIALGVIMWSTLLSNVSDAVVSGQVTVFPRYRGGPAVAVAWPRAWSIFVASGWVSVVFVRYLWVRLVSFAKGRSIAHHKVDTVLAVSVLPAFLIFVLSGSLSTLRDAIGTLLLLAIFALTFLLHSRFGKGVAVAAFAASLVAVVALSALF